MKREGNVSIAFVQVWFTTYNVCVCVCVCVRACTSPGKMPTVVSPELYRARFCEAMDKYFLMVPDHWNGLGINC